MRGKNLVRRQSITSPTFNLRFKFITGLVLFALALGLCTSVILYFHLNSIMASEISQRSRMLLAQSGAVQDYVRSILRPEMFKILPEDRFVLSAMSSSYISRQIMTRLNIEDTSEYHYRRVSINPRNQASRADSFEAGLIDLFNADRGLTIWEDNTFVNGKEYHMVAEPVTFTVSCMQCHGDPEDAPRELIDRYGDISGFHYRTDEVAGVVVAGFPVDLIRTPAMNLTLQYMGLYLLGIILFAGLISLFFDHLVMKNLHALTRIFKTRFSGEQEQGIIHRMSQKDEIEGLIEGVDELAGCLSNARTDLEDHALNLEKRVEERTERLHTEAKQHLADVHLFVNLLAGFNGMQNTLQLITDVLERVGKRFNASQVIYYCTVASENYYAWKPDQSIKPPDKKLRDLLWENKVRIEHHRLYIPIKSPESHWGILCIFFASDPDPGDLDPDILLALGHQMAILIENIQIFSNIRFQNDLLQSIVEGICDPLLLIDPECRIIIANKGCSQILPNSGKGLREKELKALLSQKPIPGTGETLLDRVIQKETPVGGEIKTRDNRYFSINLYPLPRQDQIGLRIVVHIREITLEKQMVKHMQKAERLSATGKLAAGIAHEINNPLGVIQLYTDLVKDAVTDPDTLDDIAMISKHTRSVQKIVRDLLSLSRPKQVILGRCSINAVVASILEVFKTQGASKNISISFDPNDPLPDIKCDAAILEQILTNLWLNAFDAISKENGRIHIITRMSSDRMVILGIEDNGHGIPKDVISHIFDPFFTTKQTGKGTGLGLSVVYGFITELGGRIEVESDDTTRFNVFFPILENKN
ncbi:MAG: hypothetical protein A2277_17485 [Desulfobacterales bacterium RIFOXYA12_FULL_46_15]|nr:MAG: hypothetical protein A2277_17485 [Desulfobacterales bacterium RIFOXYA12_FULL_46_15]